MSALAGLFHLDGRPAATGAAAMLATLGHRGGEVVGTWAEGAVGLGFRADALAPRQAGMDAIARVGGRFACAASARLDARDALAHALGVPSGLPDNALVGHAFARWGADTPRHLKGDFAFAVWDAHARRLFCARDRMGVRPFYYLHEPGRRFAFATEIRALQALPGFPNTLDETHLADYLLVTLDHTSTFFRAVRRLPAATHLAVGVEGVSGPQSYWAPDAHTELVLADDEAYAEGFRAHFGQAVARRLESRAPVGAALSGGLDSSSIAVVARDLLPARPFPVFCGQFAGMPPAVRPAIDERPYMDAVAATGGFDVHAVDVTDSGPFADYDRVAWHLEDLFRTINLYMHWELLKRARGAGVRVFLDGADGDTTVSHGFERLTALALAGDWRAFARQITAFQGTSFSTRHLVWTYGVQTMQRRLRRHPGQALRGAYHLRRIFGLSGRTLGRAFADALAPGAESALAREALRDAFIRPDFARREEAWPRHRASRPPLFADPRHAHAHDLRSPLYPLILEMADHTAGAWGVEMRYPFFDDDLVAYCLSLPAHQKLGGGETRHVLKNAMRGLLPEMVRTRSTKGNLKPAFDLALARDAAREVAPYLFAADLAVAPYVDVDAVRAAYHTFLADPLGHSAMGTQLYAITTLERGLRRLGLV